MDALIACGESDDLECWGISVGAITGPAGDRWFRWELRRVEDWQPSIERDGAYGNGTIVRTRVWDSAGQWVDRLVCGTRRLEEETRAVSGSVTSHWLLL